MYKYESLMDELVRQLGLPPQYLEEMDKECRKIIKIKKQKYIEHAKKIINEIDKQRRRKITL